jgi:hypothetical protein
MIFGKLLNRIKEKRGSLSDRVVEGLDMMGGMPRDMMPRRGSGIMDGMRNRRFFDRFRNRPRPRPRPIRPIDEMPVSLLPRVELGQGTVPGFLPPDPEMMRPDPGRAFPGFKDLPVDDGMMGKMPVEEEFLFKKPINQPMPMPIRELKPVKPLPDINLLRPEDRRRFLEKRPIREQMPVMLEPDIEVGEQLPPPELSPEAIAEGIKRPRMLPGMRGFSEGGIASMGMQEVSDLLKRKRAQLAAAEERRVSDRDLLGRTISDEDVLKTPMTPAEGRKAFEDDILMQAQLDDKLGRLINLGLTPFSANLALRENLDPISALMRVIKNPESNAAMRKIAEESGVSEMEAAFNLVHNAALEMNPGSLFGQDMPQMSEGGAVKLTEQSVEFMPGTDIGMMLDDLSDVKKKAQMMS